MARKILVTGGAGYIGYHVVKELLKKKDIKVRILDTFIYERSSLDEFKSHPRLEIFKGDICNIATVVKAIKGIDSVVALAAIVGDPACSLNKEQTLASNRHATHLLVEICNYYKIKRLIFASTCSVYGASDIQLNEGSSLNPLSLYAQTKKDSEKLIMKNANHALDWVILRFGTVFGLSKRMRFDLVANFLTAKAFFGKEIDVIGGEQWRPLVHVHDVARATVMALLADADIVAGEIFNVGGDKLNFKIKEVGREIKRQLRNTKINYHQIDRQDKRNYRVSFEKILHHLNFEPKYDLQSGIKEMINYLKKENPQYLKAKYYNVKYLFKYFKK